MNNLTRQFLGLEPAGAQAKTVLSLFDLDSVTPIEGDEESRRNVMAALNEALRIDEDAVKRTMDKW